MPFYIGDYLRDTQHLNAEKHGAYVLLIFAYWASGRPLPDDDEHLATICRMPVKRWRAIRPIIARFFQQEGDEWRHKRVDHELQRSVSITASRSDAGRIAAKVRWDKQTHAPRIDDAMRQDAPSQSPTQIQEEERTPLKAPRKRVACLDADQSKIFEEWYAVYPLRKARLSAEKAFLAALARASPAELMIGAARYRDECAGKEARYIAHPSTWLNAGRWKDELPHGSTATGTVHALSERRRPTAPPRPEDLVDVGT